MSEAEPPEPVAAATEPVRSRQRLARFLTRILRRVSGPVVRAIRPFAVRMYAASDGRRARVVLAALVLTALALLLVLRQIDTLLHAMHVPAAPGYGVQDMADLGLRKPRETRPEAVLATWDEYRSHSQLGPGPRHLARVYLWFDCAFVGVYAVALALLLARSYRRLGTLQSRRGRETYRRLLAAAVGAVPFLALADLSENVATFVALRDCTGDCSAGTFWWLVGSALLKWLLVIGVAVPLVLAAFVGQERGFVGTVLALRIPLASVGFLALMLFGPLGEDQFADVIRRWASLDFTDALLAGVLMVWLGVLILVVTRRVLELELTLPRGGVPNLGVIAVIGIALLGIGLKIREANGGGGGFTALGALLVAVVVLSLPIRGGQIARRRAAGGGTTELPALLAAGPPALLGLATIQASVVEIEYGADPSYWLLVVIGALLLLAAVWLYARGYSAPGRRAIGSDRRRAFLVLSALLAGAAAAAVWIDPWWAGDTLGVLGAAGAFLIGGLVLGYVLQRVEYRWLPPPFFSPFHLRRMPILLMLAGSAVIAAFLDQGGYHNVRRLQPTMDAREITLEKAWQRWLRSQDRLPDIAERTAVPLVFVAAEGGGIRAAYWAARVLDCALAGTSGSCGYDAEGGPASLRSVFAASGASGGSLGLVTAVVAARQGSRPPDWVDDRLGDDYLAATSARTLFGDIPNSLLKLDLGPDRAAVLEQAWERSWDGEKRSPLETGLLAGYRRDERVPVLILTGTSVRDGCRVNTSVLNADVEESGRQTADELRVRDCLSLDPFRTERRDKLESTWALRASHDLVDHLCDVKGKGKEDVRLSTAALLSARFPYVSPSGRLGRCGSRFATFVVDGGYFDNTGASPLLELWEKLRPRVDDWNETHPERCLVPLFLHIDNHARAPARSDAQDRPFEVLVPPAAIGSSRGGHESNARHAAAFAFRGPFGPYRRVLVENAAGRTVRVVRHAYVYPRVQPGTDAPLGWALSQASMTSLTKQLRGENEQELANVRRWFSPTLRCSPALEP